MTLNQSAQEAVDIIIPYQVSKVIADGKTFIWSPVITLMFLFWFVTARS